MLNGAYDRVNASSRAREPLIRRQPEILAGGVVTESIPNGADELFLQSGASGFPIPAGGGTLVVSGEYEVV